MFKEVVAKGGTFSFKIWYLAEVFGIKTWVELDSGKGDICEHTKCPIKKGYVTVKYKKELPPNMPPVHGYKSTSVGS